MTIAWAPDLQRRRSSALTAFATLWPETKRCGEAFDYKALHRWSVERRQEFWSRVWNFCEVIGVKGERILVDGEKMPGSRWFPDARLNFAQNLLRERPDNDISIIFRGEDRIRRIVSFGELKRLVASFAAYLRESGFTSGDRVVAYMHNGPEAIAAMLASAAIGAVWASCSPDFGPRAVLDRFGQIEPKLLIVSDGYFYKGQVVDRLDSAREIASKLPSVRETVVVPYIYSEPPLAGFTQAQSWPDAISAHDEAELNFEAFSFDHPLYVMFSSGTTGTPKCIMHGAGGTLLQHLKEHQLQCDIRSGDRVHYATTIGWMMWNWLASVLASRATILLYDGFALMNKGEALFDYAQAERATLFGTSASYLRALQRLGVEPKKTHDLSSLRMIASTGSPLLPDSFDYVYRSIKQDVQLASISGGTDIISCFVCGNPWSPVRRGEIQGAGLGMAVEVWDGRGERIIGSEGELVCTQSFPSMPTGFWNDVNQEKYFDAYFSKFPGVWRHGDYATETLTGGFIIHGRSDATLNPHGVRIGTADIYAIVQTIPEIEDALAVDHDSGDGARIILFVTLRPDRHLDELLERSIRRKLRDEASPRHVPELIIEAPDLPHTRSGKLVELAVRDIIQGRPVKNVEALANPEALDFFRSLALAGPHRSDSVPRPP
jgi:acetoacetyl-CoA synthetase